MKKADFSVGLYEKSMPSALSLQDKLICAKRFGYDFLEMSIDESEEKLARLDMTKFQRRELVEKMFDENIGIRTLCLSGHRKYPLGSNFPEVRTHSMEIMKKAIDLSCDLGIRIIQLAGYDVYYEKSTAITRACFEDNLYRCAEMAARAGVILAFETMETPFMDTVKKAMFYINRIQSPYLQIYPDIGNCTNSSKIYGIDIIEDMTAGKGFVTAVHLKETVPGKYRDVPYGEGHVDFPQVIQCAWNMGVRILVTEFWDTPLLPYEIHIQQSKAFIDQMILRALF